jgi:hypothetical protein
MDHNINIQLAIFGIRNWCLNLKLHRDPVSSPLLNIPHSKPLRISQVGTVKRTKKAGQGTEVLTN